MSVNSPAPSTPQTATKAKTAGTITAILLLLLGVVQDYIAKSDGLSLSGMLTALVAAVVGGGLSGYATYNVPNRPL